MKKTWLVHAGKNPGTFRYNKYNTIKADWKEKVVAVVKHTGFIQVEACYFSYLVVEKTRKRDPSNIASAATKFIEDGLIEAGVMPNDGWDNVLGINCYWELDRPGEAGVFVLMTDSEMLKKDVLSIYGKRPR